MVCDGLTIFQSEPSPLHCPCLSMRNIIHSCADAMLLPNVCWLFCLPVPKMYCPLVPFLFLAFNLLNSAFTAQWNRTRVRSEANQDACFQVDLSSFVGSTPEVQGLFKPNQTSLVLINMTLTFDNYQGTWPRSKDGNVMSCTGNWVKNQYFLLSPSCDGDNR